MVTKYKCENATCEFCDISSAIGFWILDAYCRIGSTLHLRGCIDGEQVDCLAEIESTTCIDSRILIRLFGDNDQIDPEQKQFLTVADADFRFAPVGSSCSNSGGKLDSALEITFPHGGLLVLEEKLPEKDEVTLHDRL